MFDARAKFVRNLLRRRRDQWTVFLNLGCLVRSDDGEDSDDSLAYAKDRRADDIDAGDDLAGILRETPGLALRDLRTQMVQIAASALAVKVQVLFCQQLFSFGFIHECDDGFAVRAQREVNAVTERQPKPEALVPFMFRYDLNL